MCLSNVKSISDDCVVAYKVFYKNIKTEQYRTIFDINDMTYGEYYGRTNLTKYDTYKSTYGPGFHAFANKMNAQQIANEIINSNKWNVQYRDLDEQVVICKVILFGNLEQGNMYDRQEDRTMTCYTGQYMVIMEEIIPV